MIGTKSAFDTAEDPSRTLDRVKRERDVLRDRLRRVETYLIKQYYDDAPVSKRVLLDILFGDNNRQDTPVTKGCTKCFECRFWDEIEIAQVGAKLHGTGYGRCHRKSPSVYQDPYNKPMTNWPNTYCDWWCGEGEPRDV